MVLVKLSVKIKQAGHKDRKIMKETENIKQLLENDQQVHKALNEHVKQILGNRRSDGSVNSRESVTVEFKEQYSNGIASYARTMAAFANKKGGYIIFGVADSPRKIVGLKNDKFENLQQEKITDYLNSLFSPEIEWDNDTIVLDGIKDDDSGVTEQKKIGWIYVFESERKPVIAQKTYSNEKISAGDVFYRYRARSEKIKPADLERIIAERVKNEKESLFRLIEAVRKSGSASLGIVNFTEGKFSTPHGVDLAIDKKIIAKLLKKVKFIKEGSFSEKNGAPAIKVIGDIDLAENSPSAGKAGNPDEMYPYIQSVMAQKLKISPYDLRALIWHFGMKDSKEFHMAVTLSKKGNPRHKFSDEALEFLRKKLMELSSDKTAFDQIKDEYKNSLRAGKNKQHKKPNA